MLALALTTLLALQAASASPGVVPGVAPQAPDSPPASTPEASPAAPASTPTPSPRTSPTPGPKTSTDFLVVVNKSDDTVSILDSATGRMRATVPVEPGPHEAEVAAGGKVVAISNYGRSGQPGRTVTLLDPNGGRVISKIDVGEGSRPHGLKALADGRLLVTAEGTRELLILDPRTGRITARILTGRDVSHMVAASPDGKRAYVTSLAQGALTVIDLVSGKVVQDVATGKGAEGVAVTPDGREVWVANRDANSLSVIDAKTLAVVSTIKASEFPIRVKITPDGRRAIVTFTGSGDVGVFDVATRAESSRIAIGRDAVEGTETRVFQKRFGSSPAPVGLLIAPDGKRAFVSAAHADVVAVIDLERLRVDDAWTAGREPDGLAGHFGPPKPPEAPTLDRRATPRMVSRTPRAPMPRSSK